VDAIARRQAPGHRQASGGRPDVVGPTLIKPKQVSFLVKGVKVKADVLILWEKNGRRGHRAGAVR
jgi:hypothetical protein